MGVDRARVAVVIAHECLAAAQDGFLWVVEVGGDNTLESEGEDVTTASAFVVEFVADAVQEVVSSDELAAGAFGDDFSIDEFLEGGEAAFDTCDPEDILVIAQAAAAFLDLRLLKEDGMGVFVVALAQVLAPELEKGLLTFADALLVETFGEGVVEGFVADNQACVHEGGFADLVFAGFTDALGNRAAGMANLESGVPEDVEDLLDRG